MVGGTKKKREGGREREREKSDSNGNISEIDSYVITVS